MVAIGEASSEWIERSGRRDGPSLQFYPPITGTVRSTPRGGWEPSAAARRSAGHGWPNLCPRRIRSDPDAPAGIKGGGREVRRAPPCYDSGGPWTQKSGDLQKFFLP